MHERTGALTASRPQEAAQTNRGGDWMIASACYPLTLSPAPLSFHPRQGKVNAADKLYKLWSGSNRLGTRGLPNA